MTSPTVSRVAAGIPTGGQFASQHRSESVVTLRPAPVEPGTRVLVHGTDPATITSEDNGTYLVTHDNGDLALLIDGQFTVPYLPEPDPAVVGGAAIAAIRSAFEDATFPQLCDLAEVMELNNADRKAFESAWTGLRHCELRSDDDASARLAAEDILDTAFPKYAHADLADYGADRAISAVHDAARAVADRHLIGQEPGWTQQAYEHLTAPWFAVFGPPHPDDAGRARPTKESLRTRNRLRHPSYPAFQADLARFDALFRERDAILEFEDGSRGVDGTKLPDGVLTTYGNLMQFGYVNGLIG